MKRLTLNQVAMANLKMNKKSYMSLFLGILLAVFLATATGLCAWGTLEAHEEQMARKVGKLDMFLLGGEGATDEELRESGMFREIGHVTVTAAVEGTRICTGYYDETADKLMYRSLTEGRMPEKAGEIAAERSALIRLKKEDAQVGDTLTLNMQPIGGVTEERSFTLVGILNDQTDLLETYDAMEGTVLNFPALLVSPEEKAYQVGTVTVHRVMTYAPLITLNQVVRRMPDKMYLARGVSRETGRVTWYDSGWERAEKMLDRVLLWGVLGAALLLAACVAITSAMESLLARKTQDIGMLRAVGATRRQIRRIYGKEAWLLAATALPAGLLAGTAAAFIISRIAPDSVAFAPNPWLLIPIVALSALCVFAASRLPLYRASRRMPMGVLRDTGLLRRAGKTRNHKIFKPSALIAERQTRLHPLRRLGAAGMTALTLASTLLLGELTLGMDQNRNDQTPAFQVYGDDTYIPEYDAFSQMIPENVISRSEIESIEAIGGVSRVEMCSRINANLLMTEMPEYFRSKKYEYTIYGEDDKEAYKGVMIFGALASIWTDGNDWLFYTEEEEADARARADEDWSMSVNVTMLEEMNAIRNLTGITEKTVPVPVYIADLDAAVLQGNVTDGTIDLSRLDSGEQVLVYAPDYAIRKEEEGGFIMRRGYMPGEIDEAEYDTVIHNDAFAAGMPLNLLELAGKTDEADFTNGWQAYYAGMETVRAGTTIGAVLSGDITLSGYWMDEFCVITTQKGAEAMGLIRNNPSQVNVYLDGNLTTAQEDEIKDQVEQIAIRNWMEIMDNLEQIRAYSAKKTRQIMLFAGLMVLFFAVSVFMQVSGTERQIRAETRMIGTLRAVGANLKTMAGCYRLPVWICVAAGLIPPVLFYAGSMLIGRKLFTVQHPLVILPLLAVMAGCIAMACMAGIRRRLAVVFRQSIVENIREL